MSLQTIVTVTMPYTIIIIIIILFYTLTHIGFAIQCLVSSFENSSYSRKKTAIGITIAIITMSP